MTGWYIDDEAQTHSAVRLSAGGQSARHHHRMRAPQSRVSSSSLCGPSPHVIDSGYFDSLYRARQSPDTLSLNSLSTLDTPPMDEHTFLTEMAKLEETFRSRRNSADSISVYSVESGFESPVGWEAGDSHQPLNCLGIEQLDVASKRFGFVKDTEQPLKTVPSFITEMQREERTSLGVEIDVDERAQRTPWRLQDDRSRQREHNKFAANCASNMLVATTCSPSTTLRGVIARSPLLNRRLHLKNSSRGISNLDEPSSYQRRSEEEETRSLSASVATTASSSSKWNLFTPQLSPRKKISRPLVRTRAYTSYHSIEEGPFK